ncbi:MAG: hypothetical protein RQ733_01425 [Methyloprofundus sp.]|nr:hypothetical protein [Methyloprofundus sp.]MDT8424616.1 hypothetical protein [Methyloprofundus sp.]
MKGKPTNFLAVSLYGMDGRTHKTMTLFIQGACKGVAQIVEEHEAEVDIIDADTMDARVILNHCLARKPLRPIIILSLEKLKIEHTIFVEKPAKIETMLAAFKEAQDCLTGTKKKSTQLKPEEPIHTEVKREQAKVTQLKPPVEKQAPIALATETKVFSSPSEQKKTAKHKAAMMINERNFSSFIGIVPGVDFNNPEQWRNASYNPKQYYQGYVQSSIQVAQEKGQVIKLNSGWKPLIILPHSHELWIDADDKQLRAFANVQISPVTGSGVKVMTLSKINLKEKGFSTELNKIQEMNAFVWKLACWTSKGRYPQSLILTEPVCLKQWPNFTRLVITPHAMRIAALLIVGPRSMLDIIRVLQIKPQYVFVFVSAAYAIGILEQAKRQADNIVTAEVPTIKSVQKKSLFSRILNKLRSSDKI